MSGRERIIDRIRRRQEGDGRDGGGRSVVACIGCGEAERAVARRLRQRRAQISRAAYQCIKVGLIDRYCRACGIRDREGAGRGDIADVDAGAADGDVIERCVGIERECLTCNRHFIGGRKRRAASDDGQFGDVVFAVFEDVSVRIGNGNGRRAARRECRIEPAVRIGR